MQQDRQRQPSPAYRAFWRLRERYGPEEQRRIDQAMSVLGITPEDKIWLAVTIAADLIGELAREGSGIAAEVRAAIGTGTAALDKAVQRVSGDARNLEQAASNATRDIDAAAARVTDAATSLAEGSRNAAQSIGTQVGKEIASTHASELRAITQQRDTAEENVSMLSIRNVLLGITIALLVGVLVGYWLHGNQVSAIVSACRHLHP